MNFSVQGGTIGAIAVVVLYAVFGFTFPIAAWHVRRRWGGRGLVLLALIMAAAITLLLQSWLSWNLAAVAVNERQLETVPRIVRAFFLIWLLSFGVAGLVIERHHRRGHSSLTPGAAIKALAGLYASFLVAFLAYAAIELRVLPWD